MKIKMLTTMAGPEGVSQEGAIVEKDEESARALIKGGYAVAVDDARPAAEKTAAAGPRASGAETATAPDAPEHADGKPVGRMTKAELLELAASRGLDAVDDGWTVAEIREALGEAEE